MGRMKDLDMTLKGFPAEMQKDFNDILYKRKQKMLLSDPEDIAFFEAEFDYLFPFFFEIESE